LDKLFPEDMRNGVSFDRFSRLEECVSTIPSVAILERHNTDLGMQKTQTIVFLTDLFNATSVEQTNAVLHMMDRDSALFRGDFYKGMRAVKRAVWPTLAAHPPPAAFPLAELLSQFPMCVDDGDKGPSQVYLPLTHLWGDDGTRIDVGVPRRLYNFAYVLWDMNRICQLGLIARFMYIDDA
jgi:hypothetical protein